MYYNVAFVYQGPRVNIIGEDESSDLASKALSKAERLVELKLKEAEIRYAHAYCWPDGSLYKYIKTDLSSQELQAKLEELFKDTIILRFEISETDPKEDPYKYGCKTLAEYLP